MKIQKVGINYSVQKNYFKHSVKDNVDQFERDNSTYKVKISEEALKLLLESSQLSTVIPKTEPDVTYSRRG